MVDQVSLLSINREALFTRCTANRTLPLEPSDAIGVEVVSWWWGGVAAVELKIKMSE